MIFLVGGCQQGDVIQVPRSCLTARRYSQGLEMPLLPVHLPVTHCCCQPPKNRWEAKKNLHPHLGFLQEWAEKRISGGLGTGRRSHISHRWLHFSMVVILRWCLNGSCRAQDVLGHLLAAMLFLEGKGAVVPSPAQSRETFLLCLYWNDPSWWLKIGLRRWRGRTAPEKIGWPMFNQAALKCTWISSLPLPSLKWGGLVHFHDFWVTCGNQSN